MAAFATSRDTPCAVWSAGFAGLITLSAIVGVSLSLPILPELQFALGLLVLGVGYASMTLGVAMRPPTR